MRRFLITLLASATLLALPAARAAATPGDFDPSFAGTGLVAQAFGDGSEAESGHAVVGQPDGKTVVAGWAALGGNPVGAVARYQLDGTLDPSFGSGGKVLDTTFGAWAVTLQPDGKIVAAGEAAGGGGNNAYAFVRYLPNGNPDPSFGGGTGRVIVLVKTGDNQQRAQAVIVQPDGKIVAAGLTNDGAGFVRLLSDGTPDPSFAGDGSVDVPLSTVAGAEDVAVQPDGSVLAPVPTGSGLGDGFTLVKVDSHGTPDASFAPGGVLHVTVGSGAVAEAVGIQPDGKIVVGGTAFVGSGPDQFAIARFNPSGSPDMSFSGDGQEITPVAPNNFNADGRALIIQPNGRIVLAGEADLASGTQTTFAYVRYNAFDGSLDSSFGSGGIELSPFPAGWDRESFDDARLACNGDIVATGFASTAPTAHAVFLTTRIVGDPIPCPGLNPVPPLPATPDHTKPHSHIRKLPRVIRQSKLKRFSGTAADDNGVAKVEVALLRRVGKVAAFSKRSKPKASCMWLASPRAKFKKVKPRHGRCASPRWLRASGTTSWAFKLRKRLPPAHYVLYVRATDTSGNTETSFTRAGGNRADFRVRKG